MELLLKKWKSFVKEKYKVRKSYKKRFLLIGKTKKGRMLEIVISGEDRNAKPYGEGIYYLITAYEKEEL